MKINFTMFCLKWVSSNVIYSATDTIFNQLMQLTLTYNNLVTGDEICQQPHNTYFSHQNQLFLVRNEKPAFAAVWNRRPVFFFWSGKCAAIITVNIFQSGRRYAAGHCDRDGPQNTSQFPGSVETAGHPRFSQLWATICSLSVWWSG